MERLRQNHLGGFFKVLKPGPRHAPVTAVPAAGPGNLHFARAAREVSQARSILGSANRGFCRLCGGGAPRVLVRGILLRRPTAYVAVPRPDPAGGDSVRPRSPEFEVCTCFQNLTTFLPRRTPFWSVILRATKRRSPPWTLVPMANNLVSFFFFFFFLMIGKRSTGLEPCLLSSPQETHRGPMWVLRATGDSGNPAQPGTVRARVGPSQGHLGHTGPGPPSSPAQPSRGPGLAGKFHELTTRRSEWEREGFVLGPGRVGCWLESL